MLDFPNFARLPLLIFKPDGSLKKSGEIAYAFQQYYDLGFNRISHQYFRENAALALSYRMIGKKLDDIISACPQKYLAANRTLFKLLKNFPQPIDAKIQALKPKFVNVGDKYTIKCQAQLTYIDLQEEQRVVIFQTNDGYEEKTRNYGLICALAKRAYCNTEMKKAKIQIIDLSKPPGLNTRSLQVRNEEDLKLYDNDMLNLILTRLAEAKAEFDAKGSRGSSTTPKRLL